MFAVFAATAPSGIAKLLDPVVKILVDILNFGYQFLHNWGWSIVFLTIVVRIILIPLTWKQFKSMRAMQALQPQINQKMMEFYKENQVSPFGSCLPLVLQMPVFFSLFYALKEQTSTFAGSNWLWIRDWSASQPAWIAKDITKFDLILLVLYVGSQFLSSKQMMTSTDPTQKMMMYMMPVVIGVVMFVGRWPAGLFIYWFTSNLWTIFQQYIISKTMPVPQGVPVASGGTSGETRERKKPKAKQGKR
jgi:YidC/Oxa1 family membrane protein insertase